MVLKYLEQVGPLRIPDGAVPVVTLAHNERHLLEAFLDHYRGICRPAFLVVDDRSDDGTREVLEEAPDVTVFSPRPGSTYGRHKAEWRASLLDLHGRDRWCLLPDLDELFVFPRMEERPLTGYLADLDRERAEAVLCVMVDMYADVPLAEHRFNPASGESLLDAFPFFDTPGPPPGSYFFLLPSAARRRSHPTPGLSVRGGLRHRLFYAGTGAPGTAERALLTRFGSLANRVKPGHAAMVGHALTRRAASRWVRDSPDVSKVGLIRWRGGGRLSGGAHAVSGRLRASESIAAFLHFKFTKGAGGITYVAGRGSHADGSRHYRTMLERPDLLAASPVFGGTRRYAGSASLAGIMREARR